MSDISPDRSNDQWTAHLLGRLIRKKLPSGQIREFFLGIPQHYYVLDVDDLRMLQRLADNSPMAVKLLEFIDLESLEACREEDGEALHPEKLALLCHDVYSRAPALWYSDPLTGLASARAFQEKLAQRIEEYRENELPFCCLMADIVRLQSLNQRFGHDFGDLVICQVAGIIRQNVGESDMAARIGGDEFGILLHRGDLRAGELLADKIVAGLEKEAIQTGEGPITPSVNIGSAFYKAGMSRNDLLASADMALYRAKMSR